MVRQAGADHVIIYTREDFVARVLELTNQKGVNAVFDPVGKTTFLGSLKCLDYRGVLALFGAASGKVISLNGVHSLALMICTARSLRSSVVRSEVTYAFSAYAVPLPNYERRIPN